MNLKSNKQLSCLWSSQKIGPKRKDVLYFAEDEEEKLLKGKIGKGSELKCSERGPGLANAVVPGWDGPILQ